MINIHIYQLFYIKTRLSKYPGFYAVWLLTDKKTEKKIVYDDHQSHTRDTHDFVF